MKTLEDTTPKSLRQAHWLALPKWVRIFSLSVGLPAWLFLAWTTFNGEFDPTHSLAGKAAVGLFASTALLQMAYLWRAYWRMDI